MRYRRSRSKIRLSPGIEKFIVILVLALCLLAAVALFSSIGDYELPWLQLEEAIPEDDPLIEGDVSKPPGVDEDTYGPDNMEDNREDLLDTPLVEITWD